MASKNRKTPPVPFIGKEDRRCRNCQNRLAEHCRVYWRRRMLKWRSRESGFCWELSLRCTACGKRVGKVAQSNMPEDPSLIPPQPPTFTQKELFHDTGR